MIVPMKKVFLVIQAKDAQGLLERVRKLGILHVENVNTPKGEAFCLKQGPSSFKPGDIFIGGD